MILKSQSVLTEHYPDCLFNCHSNLDLGSVNLRYLDLKMPALITIFELERPAILARNQLDKIIESLKTETTDEFVFKGLFTLGIAQFETMLNDLLIRLLQFYPQKLTEIKKTPVGEQVTPLGVAQEQLFNGDVIRQIIDNQVNRLNYSSIDNFLQTFIKVFSIDATALKFDEIIDELIEIKETRNSLLHNNLVVNEFYLKKTRSVKRATKNGTKLTVDRVYVEHALTLIAQLTDAIIKEIRRVYGHLTVLPLLKKLFAFHFKSPIIKFELFCTLNEDKDIYDGPFNMPEGRSSSENFFLEFWQAQRDGTAITRPALCYLSDGRMLALFCEVFGEFRFPYW